MSHFVSSAVAHLAATERSDCVSHVPAVLATGTRLPGERLTKSVVSAANPLFDYHQSPCVHLSIATDCVLLLLVLLWCGGMCIVVGDVIVLPSRMLRRA